MSDSNATLLTTEQQRRRLKGIGASDVAAILGLDKYRTPYQVWMEKTGRIAPFAGNEATKMGNLLEPVIAQLYQERNPGVELRPCETIVGDEEWMLATPDRVAMVRDEALPQEWLVEIKSRSSYTISEFGEEGTDECPPDVLCQVMWQMKVTGLGSADVALLVDGRTFRQFRVDYDADLAKQMYTTLREWWYRHVVDGLEPEPTPSERIEQLKERFAVAANKEKVPATPMIEESLQRLANVKHLQEVLDDEKVLAQAEVMEFLGSAYGVIGEAGTAIWYDVKGRVTTDWKEVVEACRPFLAVDFLASTIESHTYIGPNRRDFRFTPSKKPAILVPELPDFKQFLLKGE
jgi:putative phage-type endonuclease